MSFTSLTSLTLIKFRNPLLSTVFIIGCLLGSQLAYAGEAGQPAQDTAPHEQSHFLQQEIQQLTLIGRWLKLDKKQQAVLQQTIEQSLTEIKQLPKPDPGRLLDSQQFDPVLASRILEERAQWKRSIELEIMETIHELYGMLTPEQQSQFRQALNWHLGAMPRNQKEIETLPFPTAVSPNQ